MSYNRVIIVDPQLKDCKGHNYRYAMGIAADLGLPAVVLSHYDFCKIPECDLDVRPCLSFDQYNNSAFKDSYGPGLVGRLRGLANRLYGRMTQTNAIWEQQSPLGLTIAFLIKLLAIIFFVPALIIQIKTLLFGRGSSAHKDTTALELNSAFESVSLKPGDLLIFQTMMWPTFESLLELRIHAKQIFNCDALFIVHEDWLIYNTGFIRFTPASFEKRVLQALPFKRSKVVSTNEVLSDYTKEWSGYRPDVIKEIEFPLSELPQVTRDKFEGTRILIPGVYRGDKNFESVGLLVEKISEIYEDVTFCLHESVISRVALPPQYGDQYTVYSDVDGAQQWLKFLGEFDLILLPYGSAYRHRISGIIHEAQLLNVPVVCHYGIADAALITHSECLYRDRAEGVARAVSFCLKTDKDQALFNTVSTKAVVPIVSDNSGWVSSTNKPIAAQVKPAWTRCGTSTVLDAQMDYLVDRGYFVIEVYLKSEPWKASADQVDFLWQVMRGGREYSGGMIVRLLLKDVTVIPLSVYLTKLIFGQIPAFFKRENIHHTWCKPDAELSHFLQNNEVELVLVNHMFNNDFARKYFPAKKYICETHDIQLNQLLLRRPELNSNYDKELKYELDVLNQYDALINLNSVEHKLFEKNTDCNNFYIQPPIVNRPISFHYESLVDLLADQSEYDSIDRVPDLFDLLIVADGHPANIESVNMFIDKVFSKLPENTSLGVVGKVGSFLKYTPDHKALCESVHAVGFVQDLANIYDFTRIVILPDIIGEGVAIKSNETIAKQIPFVATECALRGFSRSELSLAGIFATKNNEEMVQRIVKMLENKSCRDDVSQQAKCLSEMRSLENYYSKWDAVIEALI